VPTVLTVGMPYSETKYYLSWINPLTGQASKNISIPYGEPCGFAVNRKDNILYYCLSHKEIIQVDYSTGTVLPEKFSLHDSYFHLVAYDSNSEALIGTTYTGIFSNNPTVATLYIKKSSEIYSVYTSDFLTLVRKSVGYDEETQILYVSCEFFISFLTLSFYSNPSKMSIQLLIFINLISRTTKLFLIRL
jgi:hypothetical protein